MVKPPGRTGSNQQKQANGNNTAGNVGCMGSLQWGSLPETTTQRAQAASGQAGRNARCGPRPDAGIRTAVKGLPHPASPRSNLMEN